MSSPAEAVVLVANSHQARKVRWVFWGICLFFVGFAYWGWDLSRTYGLSPGDGGVLKPLGSRLTAAAILLVIGLLPLIGMIAYVRRYVGGIVWRGDEVLVSGVCWPAGDRAFPLTSFEPGSEYEGRLDTIIHRVDAPWMTLSIEGRTYIVDLQAEKVDREGLVRMLRQARRLKGQGR